MTKNVQDCLQQSIWQQPLFFQLNFVLALINSLQPSQHQKQPSLLAATLQSMLCFAACLDTICSLFLWRLIQINPCKSLSSPSLSVFPRMSFKIATWGEKKEPVIVSFFSDLLQHISTLISDLTWHPESMHRFPVAGLTPSIVMASVKQWRWDGGRKDVAECLSINPWKKSLSSHNVLWKVTFNVS